MKLVQSVRTGAWLLIMLNLLLAFGCIWVFMRMAPAIDVIIVQNEGSLQACQNMLAALAAQPESEVGQALPREAFEQALRRAGNNVTEEGEPEIIERIERHHVEAFNGNRVARERTIHAILELGTINRIAMHKADRRAQQLGYAGAWGVVFMATTVFLVGMVFLRKLKSNLIDPLEEINATLDAYRNGDVLRRCSLKRPSNSLQQLLDKMNEVLDTCIVSKADPSDPGAADRRD